jgi:hypothetical protein
LAAVESGDDVFAATGEVLVQGAMAATEAGDDVFAATGGVLVSGLLAATETGEDIFEATGYLDDTGALHATETGSDVFAATGIVVPLPQPLVVADVGAERRRIKKRDKRFAEEKRERDEAKAQIARAVEGVDAVSAKVVAVEDDVAVLPVTGEVIAIPVPPAFNAAQVAQWVVEQLQVAGVDARQSRALAQRRQAEIALAALAREQARRRRQREDELLLLM